MRKVLLFALVLLFTVAMLPAQQTTWISPWGTIYPYLPQSMLSFVTSGLFYDEIDIIVRSPGELSNYDGFTFYTMYGNFESWRWTNPLAAQSAIGPVNPFTTNGLVEGTAGDFHDLLFGAAFPVLDFRAGVTGGFHFDEVGNVAGDSTYEAADTDVVDADADGVEDSRTVQAENYTDSTSNTDAQFGVGVDLGFIGVSAFGDFATASRRVGGTATYAYTYEIAEVPVPGPNYFTSANIVYGSDVDGKVKNMPTTSDTRIGAIAEITLPLGIELPIVAGATLITSNNGLPTARTPQRATAIEAEPFVGSVVADTATLSIVRGSPSTDYSAETATLLGLDGAPLFDEIPTNEGVPGLLAGQRAPDMANATDTSFGFDIHGRVDPQMPIGELGSVRLRGGVLYSLNTTSTNNATVRSMNYSGFNAAGTEVTYAYSETRDLPSSTVTNTTGLELGGVFDFASPNGFIEVAAGLIYSPELEFVDTQNAEQTTVTSVTYTEIGATEAALWTDVLGSASGIQGSRTTTSITPAAVAQKVTTATNSFFLPVATRINLAEGMFQIINSYTLTFETINTKTVVPDQPAAVANTGSISDSTGTFAEAAPVPTSIDASSLDISESTTTTNSASAWAGEMNFMLRWVPMPELTVDFFGQTVMTALDFEWFAGSGYGDLNLFNFIDVLGISATINIK